MTPSCFTFIYNSTQYKPGIPTLSILILSVIVEIKYFGLDLDILFTSFVICIVGTVKLPTQYLWVSLKPRGFEANQYLSLQLMKKFSNRGRFSLVRLCKCWLPIHVLFSLSSFWPQTPLDHCCFYSNKQQKGLCEKTCIVYKVLGVFCFMAMVFCLHSHLTITSR